jgi:pimeloyl-ACP methyl ester carboxylesterase
LKGIDTESINLMKKLEKNQVLNYLELKNGRRVVYLQHGLGGSSISWMVGKTESSLAKMLADKGYDVWMGNSRGNYFSRGHKKYKPNEEEFWKFSIDDLSKDLIATLNFITLKTGIYSFPYVGHSLGCSMILLALSNTVNPDRIYLENKISKIYCLAPVVFTVSVIFKMIANY